MHALTGNQGEDDLLLEMQLFLLLCSVNLSACLCVAVNDAAVSLTLFCQSICLSVCCC